MSYINKITPSLLLLGLSMDVSAALQSFDSRSHAMGGIGVSSADYLTAALHNPALLSNYGESDDIGLLLPAVGAQIYDSHELIDNLDDFTDISDRYDANPSLENMEELIDALEEMQGDRAYAQVGATVAIALPGKYLSTSFTAKAYADAFIVADISSEDLDESNYLDPENEHELTSQGIAIGVAIFEASWSLSKSFEMDNGSLYLGITPKYQQVNTINYNVNIDNYDFDDWDDDKYQNDDSDFNLDLGIAYETTSGFAFGASVRNLISNTYQTELINGVIGKYKVNPVYTVGASYNHRLFTIGVDVDLNENEHYDSLTGSGETEVDTDNDNTQLAGVGVEFNAWDWAQLRFGYQIDIADNLDEQVTGGIGFSPWGAVHLDLSASYAGDDQFGGVIQTYFTF